MREAAIRVLAKWRVPELARERDVRAAEHLALQQGLADATHATPWWERAIFGATQDAARIRELEGSVARAWQASSAATQAARAAVGGAAKELPPIEIAWRVEQVIAGVLADPMLGRIACPREAEILDELDAIAERVASIWILGYSPERLALALSQLTSSELGGGVVEEPRTDERLGWTPIEISELVARASVVLASGPAAAARARIHREAGEYAAVVEALQQARARLGLDDRLWPGDTPGKERVAALERTLKREHSELIAASESLLWEVERAISAFPPLAIYVAATAAAGVLRAGVKSSELTIAINGNCATEPSAGPRAVVLAALVELRRAVDATFPGLGALISGRGGRRDAEALARAARGRSQSPYRERQASDEETSPLRADAARARLNQAIENSGTSEQIARALCHAVLLGGIGRATERTSAGIGWSDKLLFWSASGEKAALDQLELRREWHRSTVSWLMNDVACRVDWAARALPLFRLRNLITSCHHVIQTLGTEAGTVSHSTVCPVFSREESLAAIAATATELGRSWGLSGTKQDLALRVTHHLTTSAAVPSPVVVGEPLRVLTYHEIVISVAEALRNTEFVAHEQRLRKASQDHAHAEAARHSATTQVSFWDELNVFSESPAEEARDAWRAEASKLASSMRYDFTRADLLLEEALAIYPPASVYFGLGTLQAYVLAVTARRRSYTDSNANTYYRCELLNKPAAVEALRRWTSQVLHVFGYLASNGELVECFVASELAPGAD